jgi:hypothetical protein
MKTAMAGSAASSNVSASIVATQEPCAIALPQAAGKKDG